MGSLKMVETHLKAGYFHPRPMKNNSYTSGHIPKQCWTGAGGDICPNLDPNFCNCKNPFMIQPPKLGKQVEKMSRKDTFMHISD